MLDSKKKKKKVFLSFSEFYILVIQARMLIKDFQLKWLLKPRTPCRNVIVTAKKKKKQQSKQTK